MKPIKLYMKYAILLASVVDAAYCYAAENLCSDNQRVYFSCKIKSKTLSLCFNPTSSKLQYKFGVNKQNPELVFPDGNVKSDNGFYGFYEGGAKGGSQAVGFIKGQYTYAVFETRSAFGYNGAGVAVSRNKKIEILLTCDKGSLESENFFGKSEELGLPERAMIYPSTEYVETK